MTRIRFIAAVLFSLAAMPAVADDMLGDPQWPSVSLDEPKWPSIEPDKLPDPRPNPNPPFLDADQVMNRIMGTASTGSSDVTGSFASWPELPPESRPSSFAFEFGARYWYSWGIMSFAFTNDDPLFGRPTSTLDWHGLGAHTGELFGRMDHKPTGIFVKGVAAAGAIVNGDIEDLDYLAHQVKFSDTTSNINSGNLAYGMLDIGWAYSPVQDIRIGFFGGYHFWRESATAFGAICNPVATIPNFCGGAGNVEVGFDTAVLRYQPTWHIVRLGFEGKAAITERWSVSGEIAAVPYALLQNKDSHLLRQDPADLGPAPNVITDSRYAYGIEAELFLNYAITPNIEIGGGARYWGLTAPSGVVSHGPTFDTSDSLNHFNQQRVGFIAQIKGKF